MFTTFLSRLLILSGVLLTSTPCSATASDQQQKIPVIHIAAKNLSPLDIGLSIGQQSKQLFPDIEHRYDTYLATVFSQMRFDDLLRAQLPRLQNAINSTYKKELEGVASSWSLVHTNILGDGHLSWDEYWLLNVLPDIGIPVNGTGFGVLSEISTEQGAIIGHNLDLLSTPELRSLQAITVYNYGNKAVVNIGFAGVLSVLSGFNESGLYVACLNAAPETAYQNPFTLHTRNTPPENVIQPKGFVLRQILENATSTRQASRLVAKSSNGLSQNTLIADKQDIQVVEYSPGEQVVIRHWDSPTRPNKQWDRALQIAVVDCLVTEKMPDNCQQSKEGYRWGRLRSLAVFNKFKKAGTQDIARIMLDRKNQYYEILAENTLQSMIYLPGSGHLYLYAAPAADSSMPASYQVYYQDIMSNEMRGRRNRTRFFWWLTAGLALLALALWLIRRSMKRKDQTIVHRREAIEEGK